MCLFLFKKRDVPERERRGGCRREREREIKEDWIDEIIFWSG